VHRVADRIGVTPAQVALAWLLHQGPDIVPIPGTKHRHRIEENVGAAAVTLSIDTLAELRAALAPERIAGERYNAARMAQVDR